MSADNTTNAARQADAEARVLAAVETMRAQGESLGLRAIARRADASVATVRKLRHHWHAAEESAMTEEEETADDETSWRTRLSVFQPHSVQDYLQSVWPEPITIDTYARWHAEMTQLRQMYGTRMIQLGSATYRMYADWMNYVLDDARQHLSPRALEYAIERWQGDPIATLLADGAIAGIQLPKSVRDALASVCQQPVPVQEP